MRNHDRICTAHKTDGVTPCGQYAAKGGTTCRYHGSGAPQVQEANARNLLRELVGPALSQLKLIVDNPKTPPAVKLAAVRDILDRTGHGAVKHSEITVLSLDVVDAEIARLEAELAEYDPDPAT